MTPAGQKGLTLVHFTAQPEPLWSLKLTTITNRIPQRVLTSGRKGDECRPLPGSGLLPLIQQHVDRPPIPSTTSGARV